MASSTAASIADRAWDAALDDNVQVLAELASQASGSASPVTRAIAKVARRQVQLLNSLA